MPYLRHKVNSTRQSDHIESFVLQLLSGIKSQTHQVGCLVQTQAESKVRIKKMQHAFDIFLC